MSKCCRVNVNIRRVSTIVVVLIVISIILAVILSSRTCLRDRVELRSSNCENFNQNTSTSSCALNSNALDDQLTKFVKAINIQRTRHFIFNVILSKSFDGLGNYTEKNLVNGNQWVWAIGDRGKTFLSFPYNDHILSITTLSLGKLEHNLALNADDINMNDNIFTDCCMAEVLFDVIQKVRYRLALNKTSAELFPKDKNDILCRQKIRETPVLSLTLIPGFSLLETQTRFHYDCFPQGIYSCYCWSVISFILALGITSIMIVYVLYHYHKGRDSSGVCASTVEDPKYVNILKIPLLPFFLWVDGKKKRQRYRRVCLLAVPLIVYFIAEVCHVAIYQFRLRWNLFGIGFRRRIIIIDIIIINVVYIAGLVALFQWEKIRQWHCIGKMPGVAGIIITILVFPFFFLRIVAFFMLMIEGILFTVAGIAIHIRTVPTFWVNIVFAIFDVISSINAFVDRYQLICKSIYTVGNRIDKEGHFWKVFTDSCQSDAEGQIPEQPKCKISCELLRNIINNELPFAIYALKDFLRLLLSLGFIILLGAFTYVIDQETNIWFVGEYALTVIPLLLFEAKKLPRNACSSKNKERNLSEARQVALEEKLRKYADTGKYPSASPQSRSLTGYDNPGQDQAVNVNVEQSAAVDSAISQDQVVNVNVEQSAAVDSAISQNQAVNANVEQSAPVDSAK
ncbi:uncharacterized protein [Diadema setosum]|uniref:uncharacterized protein n=1 Tax=Diadema setosum TaxID=31175 RepID=UPI003B3A6ACB